MDTPQANLTQSGPGSPGLYISALWKLGQWVSLKGWQVRQITADERLVAYVILSEEDATRSKLEELTQSELGRRMVSALNVFRGITTEELERESYAVPALIGLVEDFVTRPVTLETAATFTHSARRLLKLLGRIPEGGRS